jgi:GST-like protein
MALEQINKSLGILNDRLNGRQYVLGEKFTLVDLDLASVLGWAMQGLKLKVDMATYPHLGAWLGRSSSRPGMKVAMAG